MDAREHKTNQLKEGDFYVNYVKKLGIKISMMKEKFQSFFIHLSFF